MIRSPVALIAWSAIVIAVALTHKGWLGGALLALVFLALAPGSALCRLLRIPRDGVSGWVMVVATSFSIDTIVTEAWMYSRRWTPERALVGLGAITILIVAVDQQVRMLRRRARRARERAAET